MGVQFLFLGSKSTVAGTVLSLPWPHKRGPHCINELQTSSNGKTTLYLLAAIDTTHVVCISSHVTLEVWHCYPHFTGEETEAQRE